MSHSNPAPHLLSPFTFDNGLTIRNRVVLAPLTRGRSGHSRIPNELNVEYYTQRASAGLIITEATTISETGNGWSQTPGLYTPEMVEGWKAVVRSVKARGGALAAQLWHMGRASHSSFQPGGALPVAPSAIAINGAGVNGADEQKHPHEVPRALEVDEIKQIIRDYRQAAINAMEAGFDMVELHGANGYLIDEFLQSRTNQRTDQYGGSIENRFRFLREIVEAVTEVVPANRVGVRLNPNGSYNDMGSEDNVETFTYAAQELNKYHVAYLHIVDGTAFGFHGRCRVMNLMDFKRVFDGPIIGNMGYTRDTADGAIRTGAADMIAFGRPFLANPDLVERFQNDWPLNQPDYSTFYTHEAQGYTDYPTYSATAADAKN